MVVMTKKKEREIVFNKCNGRCAFCGTELKKGWHVSFIEEPRKVITAEGKLQKEADLNNLLPACTSCSLSRIHHSNNSQSQRLLSVEGFRKSLQDELNFLRMFPYYKRAVRFGLVKEMKESVVFYFETIKVTAE